jgi:MFS family permease
VPKEPSLGSPAAFATPPASSGPNGDGDGYGWFTAVVGSWFGAFGMQGVLFSWILVGELDAASTWVGTAQTASMLPSLFLLMIGGAIADHFDPRRLLIGLHLIAPLPVLALALASASGTLSIPIVIAFALAMGTLTAFCNPARDAMLSRVAGANVMSAVSGMTAVQFGSQAMGSLAAGLARVLGSPTTLCLHAVVLLIGAGFSYRMPRLTAESKQTAATPVRASGLRDTMAGMREGLSIVRRTPELRSSLIAVFAVGVFFIGPFTVVLPLMVRDVYGGGVDQLAIAFTLFPLGTITGSLVLRRVGLRRKGRAMLLALFAASILQASLGSGLPFWAFALATYGWGLGGSVFINASRTIFQERAPAAYRGRVLAAYQLGFTGGGPIGAFASGLAVSVVGLGGTLLIGASTMCALVVTMSLFSRLPRID